MICCSCNRDEELASKTNQSLLANYTVPGQRKQGAKTQKYIDIECSRKETVNHYSNDLVDWQRGVNWQENASDRFEQTEQGSDEHYSYCYSAPTGGLIETKASDHPRQLETVLMPFIAELSTDVSRRLSATILGPWRPKNATLCPPSSPFIAELLSQADTSSIPDDAADFDPPPPIVTGGAERTLLPFIAEMEMSDPSGPIVYMSAEERKAKWRAMQLAIRDRLAARPEPVID
jgi:hypothetical protein